MQENLLNELVKELKKRQAKVEIIIPNPVVF